MALNRRGRFMAYRVSESLQEIQDGFLLSHHGMLCEGPPFSPERWKDLPETMIRLHFDSVARGSLFLMSWRRNDWDIDVLFLGRWRALSFRDADIRIDSERVECRWGIADGFLSRSCRNPCGFFALGIEKVSGTEGEASLEKWKIRASVKGYPSKFLPLPSAGWRYHARELTGRIYAAYHRWVTVLYLRRLADGLQRGEFQ
jgi:hypothetical protein